MQQGIATLNEKDQDLYAPWITDPDPPGQVMTCAETQRAAASVAAMCPELVKKSQDGSIREPGPDKS